MNEEQTREQRIEELLNVLYEVRGLIDGYIDVMDGDYGVPRPNPAMCAATLIDGVL